jgi:hypothetical protein
MDPGNMADTEPSSDVTSAVNCPEELAGSETKLKKICDGESGRPSEDTFRA